MFGIEYIKEVWNNFLIGVRGVIPAEYLFLVYLAIYSLFIALYAIFIWNFYRFIAKKDIIDISLWQYIKTENNFLKKFLTSFFYLVEYLIILPFLVFFWYAILCLFFLVLARTQTIGNILLIGMAIVAAIRITAYYNEDLSRDVAKVFPLTLLAVFIMVPNFFSFESLGERIMEIPSFLQQILYYIFFVVALEFVMRILAMIKQLFTPTEVDSEEDKDKIEEKESL